MKQQLFYLIFTAVVFTACVQNKPPMQDGAMYNLDSIELVYVQGGTFMMGCTSEQGSDCDGDEKPAHQVTVSDFYIAKYEVTQAQWEAVMGYNPSNFKGDNLPVESVSWNDVQTFIRKLNAQTGRRYRLPTEAEWEFAARGGNKSQGYRYSGSNTVDDVAWHRDNSDEQPHAVGTKLPNELGIYDMTGNVDEWCKDLVEYYSSNAQTNPQGASTGSNHMLRGGGWSSYDLAGHLRVSNRNWGDFPDYKGISPINIDYDVGFRLALSSNSDTAFVLTAQNNPPMQNNAVYNPLNIELVYVEGGTFMMGCTSEQGDDCDDDEKPAHQVTVSDFYIAKYEVTQVQWKAMMGDYPSRYKGNNLPVENVSWNDVQEFIRKLNAQTGKQYRLPTEAEWEFAARGGNKSQGYKYSGSNTLDDVAWHRDNSDEQTHTVGTKSPNELGIYDMSGNVWEWCNGRHDDYESRAQTNPQGASNGFYRVIRGGSWFDIAWNIRVSFRYYSELNSRTRNVGFRLALGSN